MQALDFSFSMDAVRVPCVSQPARRGRVGIQKPAVQKQLASDQVRVETPGGPAAAKGRKSNGTHARDRFRDLGYSPFVHRLGGIERIAVVMDKSVAGKVAESWDGRKRLIARRVGMQGLLRRNTLQAGIVAASCGR